MDLSEALSLPGVVDIITADHLQDANTFDTETFLATDEVLRFCFLFEQFSHSVASHIFIKTVSNLSYYKEFSIPRIVVENHNYSNSYEFQFIHLPLE